MKDFFIKVSLIIIVCIILIGFTYLGRKQSSINSYYCAKYCQQKDIEND